MHYRSMKIGISLTLLTMSFIPAKAKQPTITYAQKLVDKVLAEHPDVLIFSIHAIPPGSSAYAIVATSVPRKLGVRSDTIDLQVIHENTGIVRPCIPAGAFEVFLPLQDAADRSIGEIRMKYIKSDSDKSAFAEGVKLQKELKSIIPNSETLFEPFSQAADESDNLGMRLLAKELVRHPDLWVLSYHLTPPGDNINRVSHTNYLKLQGTESDENEQLLARTGSLSILASPATHRAVIHVPMFDQQGNLIGALGAVYLFQDYEVELPAILSRAIAVRDELRRETPSLAGLFGPAVVQPH